MTCYTEHSTFTPLTPMATQNEIRLHQEVDLEQQCRNSDAAIQTAMDAASKAAPKGMAPELLKSAGFAYGHELYDAQGVLANCDPSSPVHGLSKQQQMALAHHGSSWLPRLAALAEAHLANGFPKSAITPDWAFARIKEMRSQAAAERRRLAVPQPTTAEVIATLKEEKDALAAELEKAKQIIAMLKEQN